MYDVPPLQNTLALATGETPASLGSRLAAMNRAASAREFCSDFLLSFKGVASGDEGELAKLAQLTSTDFDTLLAFGPRKISKEVFRLGREHIPRRIAARQTVRICPACAQHDIRSNPHLCLDAAVAQRAIWLVGSVRTCEEHSCTLVTVSRSKRHSLVHDFALCAAEALEGIDSLFEQREVRSISGFERYVTDRIWGDNAAEAPLLDRLDLKGVDLICSWLGRFILVGPEGRPRGASESEMYLAAQAGFDVLTNGPTAIRDLIQTSHEKTDFSKSLRPTDDRLLGHLYPFLNSEAGSRPQFEEIRQIMAEKISELYPFSGSVGRFLGITIERKKLHTLSDAQLSYGLSRKTIKTYALNAGIAQTVKKNGQDICYAVDVAGADELFGAGGHVMDGGMVERKLGLTRWHLQSLCEAHVISPIGGKFGTGKTAFFRRNDIEKLARDLKERATLVTHPPVGMASIGEAAMKTGWSIGSIVEHLLSGAVSASTVGDGIYRSLRVDVDQIRAIAMKAESPALNLREAATMLKIHDATLGKLANIGAIQACDNRRSATGRWRHSFDVSSLQAFERDYISLVAICRKLRWEIQHAVARLEHLGAKPAFDPAVVGCRIYRRLECAPAGRQGQAADLTVSRAC